MSLPLSRPKDLGRQGTKSARAALGTTPNRHAHRDASTREGTRAGAAGDQINRVLQGLSIKHISKHGKHVPVVRPAESYGGANLSAFPQGEGASLRSRIQCQNTHDE